MNTIHYGNTNTQEQVGSGTIHNQSLVTVKIAGTYDSVKAKTPIKGCLYSYGGDLYYVIDTVITPGRGGLANAVITLAPKTTYNIGAGSGSETPTLWEIDMVQLEKPLLCNKKLAGTDDTSHCDEVAKWRNSPAKIAAADKFVSGVDSMGEPIVEDLSAISKKFVEKIRKGIESYLVFAPVVTRTTTHKTKPDVGGDSGKICEPEEKPKGDWMFLKTGDRCVLGSDQLWVRTEIWTGADEWDTDIYEEA